MARIAHGRVCMFDRVSMFGRVLEEFRSRNQRSIEPRNQESLTHRVKPVLERVRNVNLINPNKYLICKQNSLHPNA